LLGGILCLWVLPVFHPFIGIEWMLLPAVAVFYVVSVVIGWLSNRYGLHLVGRLIDEAAIWERAGRKQEAEITFKKAVALYDSFLMSPKTIKKSSIPLIAQMARFYLARADKNEASEAFVISYLESHPEDAEVAENWLQQVENRGRLNKKFHDIANRINDSQPHNDHIQQVLARLYLTAHRTDFPALQTYRRALTKEGRATAAMIKQLSAIFIDEGRADEWALEIYLKALDLTSDNARILNGIAACAHWVPETEQTIDLLHHAHTCLNVMTATQLQTMRVGFKPPLQQAMQPKTGWVSKTLKGFLGIAVRFVRAFYLMVKFIIINAALMTRKLAVFIKTSRKSKIILKWSLVGMLAAGVIILVVNTVGYLVRTGISGTLKKKALEITVTDPFTLQVAAYLKPEHAVRYVAYLKKHNIDAYWNETVGKKKKWYQVRVSHFADKKSARAYGASLKAKGIIDDFYVANY